MEDILAKYPETVDLFFDVLNFLLLLATLIIALVTYSKYKGRVTWERNIDNGHNGMMYLSEILLLLGNLLGPKHGSPKIDTLLEHVIEIESLSIPENIKKIFQRALTFDDNRQGCEKDVSRILFEMLCLGVKSRDIEIHNLSVDFQDIVPELFSINNKIIEKCISFAKEEFDDPSEILTLDKMMPHDFADTDSILANIFDISEKLQNGYVRLMRDQ